MADNFSTPVPAGTGFAAKLIGNVLYPQNLITDEEGVDAIPQLLAALAALDSALSGTLTINLPTGAATQTTLAAVLAALQGTLLAQPTNTGWQSWTANTA